MVQQSLTSHSTQYRSFQRQGQSNRDVQEVIIWSRQQLMVCQQQLLLRSFKILIFFCLSISVASEMYANCRLGIQMYNSFCVGLHHFTYCMSTSSSGSRTTVELYWLLGSTGARSCQEAWQLFHEGVPGVFSGGKLLMRRHCIVGRSPLARGPWNMKLLSVFLALLHVLLMYFYQRYFDSILYIWFFGVLSLSCSGLVVSTCQVICLKDSCDVTSRESSRLAPQRSG